MFECFCVVYMMLMCFHVVLLFVAVPSRLHFINSSITPDLVVVIIFSLTVKRSILLLLTQPLMDWNRPPGVGT